MHCISGDAALSAGFAKRMSEEFPEDVSELRGMAPLKVCSIKNLGAEPMQIHMVTKNLKNDKPTMAHLIRCLRKTAELCTTMGVRDVQMPKIGCGLDKLQWHEVEDAIESTIARSGINVIIYDIDQPKQGDLPPEVTSLLNAVMTESNCRSVENHSDIDDENENESEVAKPSTWSPLAIDFDAITRFQADVAYVTNFDDIEYIQDVVNYDAIVIGDIKTKLCVVFDGASCLVYPAVFRDDVCAGQETTTE